jgi:hypothetical protein
MYAHIAWLNDIFALALCICAGQLGIGSTASPQTTPFSTANFFAASGDVQSLSLGNDFSCGTVVAAISDDRDYHCWGSNNNNQVCVPLV